MAAPPGACTDTGGVGPARVKVHLLGRMRHCSALGPGVCLRSPRHRRLPDLMPPPSSGQLPGGSRSGGAHLGAPGRGGARAAALALAA